MKGDPSRFEPLFHPKSVAVVGASNKPGKWGFGIMHNIINGGYEGAVLPVNRRGGSILGKTAFPSVPDLPQGPDLALIVVPPAQVVPALKDLAGKGTGSVVIITGGFKEIREQGRAIEEEIAGIAEKAGIPVIGPNCQGMMSVPAKLYAQILFLQPEPGPLSIVSQSGNIGGSIMNYGNINGIGFNKFISSGNEAHVRLEQVIEYYGEDRETRAILAYIEGIDHGRAFLDICRRVSLKKPIVAIKGGITGAGAQACASHTGAMAGSERVFEAACRQAGVIMVDDLDELFQVAASLIGHPPLRGRRVGIVTQGGGWGVLAADACARAGLLVPPLSKKTMAELDGFLADRWSRGNPVDLAATPVPDVMKRALEAVAGSESVDSVIQTNLGMGGAFRKYMIKGAERGRPGGFKVRFPKAAVEIMAKGDMAVAEMIVDLSEKFGKPILSCTDIIMGDSVRDNKTLEFMSSHGITVFPTPQAAARVLGKMADYYQWRKQQGVD
jgi:acyl-CoA synthetase (NDP forming)